MLTRGLDKILDNLAPLIGGNEIDVVVTTYASITDGDPLSNLLRSAGVDPGSGMVALSGHLNVSLGTTGVAVTRGLEQYLTGKDREFRWHSPAALQIHRMSAQRIRQRRLNGEPFWGFHPELADRVATTVRPQLDALARAAWNTPWPHPLPIDRPQNAVELDDFDPKPKPTPCGSGTLQTRTPPLRSAVSTVHMVTIHDASLGICLHIGIPRTGMASVRWQLVAVRERLQQHGVYVPDYQPGPREWNNPALAARERPALRRTPRRLGLHRGGRCSGIVAGIPSAMDTSPRCGPGIATTPFMHIRHDELPRLAGQDAMSAMSCWRYAASLSDPPHRGRAPRLSAMGRAISLHLGAPDEGTTFLQDRLRGRCWGALAELDSSN